MKTMLFILCLFISFLNICQASEDSTRILVHKSDKSLSFILNRVQLSDLSALWTEMSKLNLHQDVDVYFDDAITFRDFNDLKGFFDAYGVKNVNFYSVTWKTRKISNITGRWPVSNMPSDLEADMKH